MEENRIKDEAQKSDKIRKRVDMDKILKRRGVRQDKVID